MQTEKTIEKTTFEIVELGATDATIAALAIRYQNLVIGDNKTYDAVKKARHEVRTCRTNIDKARKEGVAEALAFKKKVDQEAKRLTEKLRGIEEPLDAEVKRWEASKAEEKAEKERIDNERTAVHQNRLDDLRSMPVALIGEQSSAAIGERLKELKALEIDDTWEEYAPQAEHVQQQAVNALESMYQGALKAEDAERQRLEQQTLAAEQRKAEEARLKAEREAFEREQKAREEERARLQAIADKKLEDERAALEAQRKEQEAEQARIKAVADKKLEAEREDLERQRKEQAEAQAHIDAENARIAREHREEEEAEANAKAKVKAEADAKAKAKREAALLPDKEKILAHAKEHFQPIPLSRLTTEEGRLIGGEINGALTELKIRINELTAS